MVVILSHQYTLAESEWKKRYGTDSVFPLEPRWVGRDNEPYKYRGSPGQNKEIEARSLFEAAAAKKPFSTVPRHGTQPDPFLVAAGPSAPEPAAKRPVQQPSQPTAQSLGPVHDQIIDTVLAGYRAWWATQFATQTGLEPRPPERIMSTSDMLALAEATTKSEAIQKLLPAAAARLEESMQQLYLTGTVRGEPLVNQEKLGGAGGTGGVGGRGGASGQGGVGGRGGRGGRGGQRQFDEHELELIIQKAGDVADKYLETLRHQPSPQAQMAQLAALRDRMDRDGASKATIQKVNKEIGEMARDYHRYFEKE